MFGNHSYTYIILSVICLYSKFKISFYDSRAEYKRQVPNAENICLFRLSVRHDRGEAGVSFYCCVQTVLWCLWERAPQKPTGLAVALSLFCYCLFLSNCKQTVVFPSLFIRHGAANLLHLIFINIRFLHVYGKELILQFDLSNTGRDR